MGGATAPPLAQVAGRLTNNQTIPVAGRTSRALPSAASSTRSSIRTRGTMLAAGEGARAAASLAAPKSRRRLPLPTPARTCSAREAKRARAWRPRTRTGTPCLGVAKARPARARRERVLLCRYGVALSGTHDLLLCCAGGSGF